MTNSSRCATTQPSHACLSESPCAAAHALSSSPQERCTERVSANSMAVDVEALSLQLGEVSGQFISHLQPVLNALFVLANSQRSLRDIEDRSSIDEELAQRIDQACPVWRDAFEEPGDAVSEMARLAKNLVSDAGERVGDIAFRLSASARNAVHTDGGAA